MISVCELGNVYDLRGLSTDTKPLTIKTVDKDLPIGNGSTFFEMDTKNVFMFDASNKEWREI